MACRPGLRRDLRVAAADEASGDWRQTRGSGIQEVAVSGAYRQRSKTSASISRLPGWQGELPAAAQPALVAGPPGSAGLAHSWSISRFCSVLGVWYSPGARRLPGPRRRPIGRPQREADIQLLVGPLAQRPQDGLI